MMRWLDAYETGAGAVAAQHQVQAFSSKKFKSHRRAPEDDGILLKSHVIKYFCPTTVSLKLTYIWNALDQGYLSVYSELNN